ncbi:lysine transporter LysE [Aureimonas sp. SA4125]|uniref:LysE family translocator n=1 Tax=Aureimonas sp. SA4125 TaxID=2826993 RepID=UPI001CC5D644|nr:LysE family translocator [Aureimonas sp. SA4125]BDA82796.1 lysine transporter LysE [Aureimonas sp. SA4125]
MPVAIDNLLPFLFASMILLVIPGPTIVMVVSQALAQGRRVALASVLGVGLGDLAAASLSLAGVGTLLAASAAAFTLLKTLGAVYLVYVGVTLWRAPPTDLAALESAPSQPRGRVFRDAFLVTLFNPKGIVFFVAFVPQFIAVDRAFAPQAVTYVALFVLLGVLNAYLYLLLASRARTAIRRPGALRAATRAGGALLMAAGIAALFARRPA